MWILSCILIGSLASSLPDNHTTTPPPTSKPSPTSTHPPTSKPSPTSTHPPTSKPLPTSTHPSTSASVTPSPSLIAVLSSIGSVCSVVLLMLVVLVVKRWVCGKPKEDAEEVRENDITDGVIYSEIITSNYQRQPARQSPESDPATIYSEVRTSYEKTGFRANRPADFLEPEVIYSSLQ